VSRLRENLTSGSYGEGLETGRRKTLTGHEGGNPGDRQAQSYDALPRQSFTRQVFFSDWKAHEGWGALTKQPGEEGSSRSLILSLLLDHCLLLHPDQLAQIENQQPAYTVGSLSNRVRVDSLLTIIRELVTANNPVQQLQRLAQQLEELFPLNPSDKPMVNRDMGRLEPTSSLKYRVHA
jgi:hypothetical protein